MTRHAGSLVRTVGLVGLVDGEGGERGGRKRRRKGGGNDSGTETRREDLTAGKDVAEGVPDMHAADGGRGE